MPLLKLFLQLIKTIIQYRTVVLLAILYKQLVYVWIEKEPSHHYN